MVSAPRVGADGQPPCLMDFNERANPLILRQRNSM